MHKDLHVKKMSSSGCGHHQGGYPKCQGISAARNNGTQCSPQRSREIPEARCKTKIWRYIMVGEANIVPATFSFSACVA